VLIDARAALATPTSPAAFTDTAPVRGLKTSAALAGQCVGDESLVAQGPRCPPAGGIECAASVPRPVGAEPRYLQSPSIITHPRHRATNNRHANNLLAVIDRHAELRPDGWGVMAMMLANKLTRLPKADRLQFHLGADDLVIRVILADELAATVAAGVDVRGNGAVGVEVVPVKAEAAQPFE